MDSKCVSYTQYKNATRGQNPSLSTGREVLNVLQNHYVERT